MKSTKIENLLNIDDRINLTIELCKFISSLYGLPEPNGQVVGLFSNILKKYFKQLTYEQIELAFEYNSCGYLNEYLPHNFGTIDNKVKFNIPDLLKIIRAFARFKKLDSENKEKSKEIDYKSRNDIRKLWCFNLYNSFDLYQNKQVRNNFIMPGYTCEVLKRHGYLDENDMSLNYVDKRFGSTDFDSTQHDNKNVIYKAFDKIISDGLNLRDVLTEFENEFNNY